MTKASSRTFQTEIQIRFRESDPAGILFFGHVFSLAHDCFEGFIQDTGLSWKNWFSAKEFIVPIRHTECDFLKPFFAGEKYLISAQVAKLGDSSFQMQYNFSKDGSIHAQVKMVHAFLDVKTKQKISIPSAIREKLSLYVTEV